jgi:endonuclease/exonuclease/phosphatase family metal-dependent hydrolase
MRLASFNLENLFDRAKALELPTWAEGKVRLDAFVRVAKLLERPTYTAATKKAILAGLTELGVLKKDDAGPFVILRQNRGSLLKRPQGKPVEVVANGRADWIGWLELKTKEVNEIATQMTARVVGDVGAHVLGVIEVENRVAVTRFNEQLLPMVGATPYAHVMVIDGNDARGIDVGVMTRKGYDVESMRSHVDDVVAGETVFSRDCPEYEVLLPSGKRLLVLVNHFKSKGFGSQATSDAKRRKQASRVRKIYDERRAAGANFVAVIGDLNDTPDSKPLDPLLKNGSDLRDVGTFAGFDDGGRPGTFGNATAGQKIDYVLLSPALFAKVTAAGVFRMGAWGGTKGTLWPHYPEMSEKIHAASDHAAIWVDLNI